MRRELSSGDLESGAEYRDAPPMISSQSLIDTSDLASPKQVSDRPFVPGG